MCANSMNELSEALRNFTIHTTDMDITGNPSGYQAATEEPLTFQAQAQEKPKPKKMRRILDWKRGRRKNLAA